MPAAEEAGTEEGAEDVAANTEAAPVAKFDLTLTFADLDISDWTDEHTRAVQDALSREFSEPSTVTAKAGSVIAEATVSASDLDSATSTANGLVFGPPLADASFSATAKSTRRAEKKPRLKKPQLKKPPRRKMELKGMLRLSGARTASAQKPTRSRACVERCCLAACCLASSTLT